MGQDKERQRFLEARTAHANDRQREKPRKRVSAQRLPR